MRIFLLLITQKGLRTNDDDSENKSDHSSWTVNRDHFTFTITSAIPNYEINVNQKQIAKGEKLDILPMQEEGLESILNINIKRGTETDTQTWVITPDKNNVPKALWGSENNSNPYGGEQLLPDRIIGVTITAPKPEIGKSPGYIDIAKSLSYAPITPKGIMPLQAKLNPTGPVPKLDENTIAEMQNPNSGMMSTTCIEERKKLFDDLQKMKPSYPLVNESLSSFNENAGRFFESQPLIID